MTEPRLGELACDRDAAVPTCATGPFGRLAWVVRELADLLRRRGGDDDAR